MQQSFFTHGGKYISAETVGVSSTVSPPTGTRVWEGEEEEGEYSKSIRGSLRFALLALTPTESAADNRILVQHF